MHTQIRLPEGWEVRKLGDIVELIKGRKPVKFVSKDSPNAKPYILISSFEKNAHQFYTDDIKCKKCNGEDVLLVWDGARAGLSSSGHKGYIGSTIVALKQKEKIILPKFLFYFTCFVQDFTIFIYVSTSVHVFNSCIYVTCFVHVFTS